jgi:hypothetical protein
LDSLQLPLSLRGRFRGCADRFRVPCSLESWVPSPSSRAVYIDTRELKCACVCGLSESLACESSVILASRTVRRQAEADTTAQSSQNTIATSTPTKTQRLVTASKRLALPSTSGSFMHFSAAMGPAHFGQTNQFLYESASVLSSCGFATILGSRGYDDTHLDDDKTSDLQTLRRRHDTRTHCT